MKYIALLFLCGSALAQTVEQPPALKFPDNCLCKTVPRQPIYVSLESEAPDFGSYTVIQRIHVDSLPMAQMIQMLALLAHSNKANLVILPKVSLGPNGAVSCEAQAVKFDHPELLRLSTSQRYAMFY